MAIAEAFRKGNLGIIDYYHLRNIQADTEMRNSIAGTGNAPAASRRPRPSRARLQIANATCQMANAKETSRGQALQRKAEA